MLLLVLRLWLVPLLLINYDTTMKRMLLTAAMCAIAGAQQTRHEIVNAAPTPAEDAKANSERVPDVYAIKSQFDRVEIWRFNPTSTC